MNQFAFTILMIGFLIMAATTIQMGLEPRGRVIIDCSTWTSTDECFRDGVAPNWRQLKGITIISPPSEEVR